MVGGSRLRVHLPNKWGLNIPQKEETESKNGSGEFMAGQERFESHSQ
jgi:hypothetical protein